MGSPQGGGCGGFSTDPGVGRAGSGRVGDDRGMPRAQPLPDELAAGAFAVADALHLGVTASRLRAADLHAPRRGVRTRAAPHSLVERCDAYARSTGDGVVFCGPTAALLLGLPLPRRLERDETLHVLQRWTDRAPRGEGIVGHKTRRPVEVTTIGVLRCTAAIPTWFALGCLLPLDDLVVVGDALIGGRRPLVREHVLRRAVDAHRGLRGAKRIRDAYSEVRAGSWSPRETRVRLGLVRAGLPEPELNARVEVGGSVYHGDLVYRHRRLVLEYEGRHHATDPLQWSRDLARYNAFAAHGWTVIRIAHETPLATVVAQVTRLLSH